MAGYVPVYLGGLKPVKDTLYMALPLYHSSAGMLALGPSFCFGLCIALRVKFSASNFWKDCVKYNCTVRNWYEVIDCLRVMGSKILLIMIILGIALLIYCTYFQVISSLSRYVLASGGCRSVIGCRPDDTVYSPLPLYHSVAGMISLAGSMKHGMSIVLRTKFSASSYWADCVKYNVTVSALSSNLC